MNRSTSNLKLIGMTQYRTFRKENWKRAREKKTIKQNNQIMDKLLPLCEYVIL